jgi:hypothetical protein
MNVKQRIRLEMFQRVDGFGIAHASAFHPSTAGRHLFDELQRTLAVLPNEDSAQVSGRRRAREGTAARLAARQALKAALEAISRTARALAVERPGFRRKFRLPSGEADDALLVAARAFAGDARKLMRYFVAYGLPDSFVDDLCGAVARVERAIADRAAGRRAHIAAYAGLNAALARAFSIVRQLDAVVLNVLGTDAAALRAWRRARRVPRRRSKDRRRPRSGASRL